MNVLFWGSSSVSVPFLSLLTEIKDIKILAVITSPDKPKGRGLKLQPTEVKKFALKKNLHILCPQKVNDKKFFEQIKSLNPEVSIVVSYGKIFTQEIIDLHKIGMLNVHFSLLPKYRGAAPIQWCLINGEEITGASVFWIERELDTGKIFMQKKVEVSLDDNYYTLSEKLINISLDMLKEIISKILKKEIIRIPQRGEISYAPMIKKEMGKISWDINAFNIHNLVRALIHWPKAYTCLKLNNKMLNLKIIQTSLVDNARVERKNFQPGQIVKIEDDGITVSCGENTFIKILKLQPENRNVITAKEFVCGYKLNQSSYFV